MLDRGWMSVVAGRGLAALGVTLGLLLVGGTAVAQAQEAHVLIYSGTVAHRHTDAINQGIGPIQAALDDADITYDWENCGEIAAIPGCHSAGQNDRIFTDENLAQYDAIFLFNAGGNTPQPLFTASDRAAIQNFVNEGGGIAANHLATDMGAGQVSWGWWDGIGNSALGTTMPAHPAAPQTATAHVTDRVHPSTRDLPDTIQHADEHYSFDRSVRGTHHVLVSLDETSYDPLAQPHGGGNPPAVAMGNDHPISWCRLYDGGRIWATAMGHFANLYTANGGDNYLIDHLVGGIQWVAGVEGTEGDCGGTVWSNFTRTILSTDVQGPIGLDIADDGAVYWTEIGEQGMASEGRLKMWDPDSGETILVHTFLVRSDALSTSEDGVLGMELDPDFESNRHVYVYYSPRGEGEGWPVAGTGHALGYNRLSRMTLNEAGTAVVAEQPILDVPKVKVAAQGDGIGNPGSPNWPAHTGGAGVDFDSEGNLYLGVGDDVNPFGAGQNGYAPMDQQYEHRYDARNTSANTNDLRGKVLRIRPLAEIEPGAEPGIGETYAIPDGNMFPVGMPDTRPEIYAMGFRQPFTVQADPAEPGTIVVGEYGPDAGTNNANRGPAGIIEWNHITEPGFFGFPFCTGDNSNANSYNRYTYPSGPSGPRYDCSQETIPNESDFNTGLDEVPGPAVPADIWHKRNGEHPPEFGLPTQGTPQEAITGPIYRHDPDNPSETKWPRYYDGSWLILDRGQNWWREAKIEDDGSGLLKANAFFQPNQFGTPGHTSVIPVKFGPDGALYLARFTGRGSFSQLMRIDYVGDQVDEDAPQVEASVSGSEVDGGYVARATLQIEATDGDGSGVDRIEYSLDGDEWIEEENGDFAEPFTASVLFEQPGDYDVSYRAIDRAGNASEVGEISFTVIDGSSCTFLRSDEFEGSALDTEKWTVRVDEPGFDATVADGALVLPVLDEIDGDRTGPLSFVAQQVPDGEWSVTTRLTINHQTNWQQAGLMLWQSDGNFVKAGFTADGPNPDQRRFELTADDPVNVRHFSPSLNVAADFPTTVWIRLFREGNLIGVDAAPDSAGQPGGWTRLAGMRAVSGADPDNGAVIDPPREGPGVMVGPYAGGHIDGPWTLDAAFDFVRFEPDEVDCPAGDAPVTSIQLNGADPVASYDGDVDVALSATPGAGGSPVDYTEYSVDGGEWVQASNGSGEDPFVTEFTVTGEGEHSIAYRSVDEAGTEEAPKSVEFTIGDGGEPGPRDIYASDQPDFAVWIPDQLDADLGDEVTWHFDGPDQGGTATAGHNVYLVAPGDDPATDSFAISPVVVPPGGDPVSYTFDEAGTWWFYCNLHAVWNSTTQQWNGTMYGTIEVGEGDPADTTPPITTVMLNGAAPAASYDGEVTATFTATDPGPDASGVDFTEYRVDSASEGDWQTYNQLSPPVVSGEGGHTVDYRSHDLAGNVEAAKTVTFTITGGEDGAPKLRVQGQPKLVKVAKRKQLAKLRMRATNTGDAASGPLRLCVKAPKKKLALRGRKCLARPSLNPGQTAQRPVRLRVKPKARGKTTRVTLIASGPGVDTERAVVRVRARR